MLFLPFQEAILIGSGLSLLLYLNRTAHPAVRTLLPKICATCKSRAFRECRESAVETTRDVGARIE
jgi:hypothetical protein